MAKMIKDFFGGHRKLPPAPPKPDYRGAENGTQQTAGDGTCILKEEDEIYLNPVHSVKSATGDHSAKSKSKLNTSTISIPKSPKNVHYTDAMDTSVALLQFKAVTEELNRKRLSSGSGLKKGSDKHEKQDGHDTTGNKTTGSDKAHSDEDMPASATVGSPIYDDQTGSNDSLLNLRFSPTLLTHAQIMQQKLPYHSSTSSCNTSSGLFDTAECPPPEITTAGAVWLPGLKDITKKKEPDEKVYQTMKL